MKIALYYILIAFILCICWFAITKAMTIKNIILKSVLIMVFAVVFAAVILVLV